MKISIADIKNQSFEKSFRGYDPEEVNTFLGELSKEMERINDDNKLLRMQLEIAEKELGRLKEVETSLFKTLKNAEESSARITEQAQEMAENYLKDSRLQTDEILLEAQKKSNILLQEAENKARYVLDEAANSVKDYEREGKALEKYRDLLVGEIRVLIGNLNETLEKYEKKYPRESLKDRADEAKTTEPKVEEVKVARVRGSRNPALAKKNDTDI